MSELERTLRRLDRERRARREAERIAETTTRALYDRHQELEVLEAVAVAGTEARDLRAVLEVAIPRLCARTGWPIGHAWVLPAGAERLESSGVWHVGAPELHGAFQTATSGVTFGPGEGLPGRVLEAGEPIWLYDVTQEDLPRKPQGLGGAFAFPVMAGDRICAVLEFFARIPAEPDEALVRLASQVGAHLTRVAERFAARDELARQALHDALTDLPNRILFEDRLELALARARRNGTLTAVLFLDADRFKVVNDTLGHRAGDRMLCELAARVVGAVRATDTVARFGGDEFAVLCEDLRDDRDALRIADAMQAALGRRYDLDGEEHPLSASIGIAFARGRDASAEGLMRDADVAMYRAKELGRGRYEIFDDRLRERLESRLRIERELRHGIEAGELRLVYQPVVSLESGDLKSVEALVRWDHPERGLVSPGEFLPVAEESGLILRVGEFVLREACRQAVRWRAELGPQAPLPINVNLAARQLGQPRLVAFVAELLAETGARSGDIALEITESAVIENQLLAVETLNELKAMGFQVLLDDFGTGYSSLSYLQRLPIDVLKIDRSFISALDDGGQSEAIVRAIVGMAQALEMTVVAEGVETDDQVTLVRDLGCGFAQGFFFARPQPPADIEQFVRSRAAV